MNEIIEVEGVRVPAQQSSSLTLAAQDQEILRLCFRYPIPNGPTYVKEWWRQLGVPINLLYDDPLLLLVKEVSEVLLAVGDGRTSQALPNSDQTLVAKLSTALVAADGPLVVKPLSLQNTTYPDLGRPPELGLAIGTVDRYLLTDPTYELYLANTRQYLDLLLEQGLALRDLSDREESRYLGPLLRVVRESRDSRTRRFAAHFAMELVSQGLDLYHDLFFITLVELLAYGALTEVTLEPEIDIQGNFRRIIDLLSEWLLAGFDINYQYAQPIKVEDSTYQSCTVLAVATLYNRVDVVVWLLQNCGLAPAEPSEPSPFPRALDPYVSVIVPSTDDVMATEEDYLTIPAVLRSEVKEVTNELPEDLINNLPDIEEYTPIELARRHERTECLVELLKYEEAGTGEINPLVTDVRDILYF